MPNDASGRAYVSSARTLCSVSVVLMFWALTEAPRERIRDLFAARRDFVSIVMNEHRREYGQTYDSPFVLGNFQYTLKGTHTDEPVLELRDSYKRTWTIPVRVPATGPSLTQIAEKWRIPLPPEDPTHATLSHAESPGGDRSFQSSVDLYYAIESRLVVSRTVKVPMVDYQVASDSIVVVLAAVVLVVLLHIRSRLRWVVERGALAREEPWIILDAERGLELSVAILWLLLVLASPLLVTTSLVMLQAAEFAVGVRPGGALVNLLWVGFTFAFLVVGVDISHKTVALLLRLRRRRLGMEAGLGTQA